MDIVSIVQLVSSTLSLELESAKIVEIAPDRLAMYNPFLSQTDNQLWAVQGTVDGKLKEIIFEYSPKTAKISIPDVSCQITYEEISLSECLEYCFEDELPFPTWRLAKVSTDAVEDFKQKKFKIWEHQLKEPECEAAFKRILLTGPIRNVYDKFIFPTPPELAAKYKVTDEHSGKAVDLPHEVAQMRIWNVALNQYVPFDASLEGAPSSKDSGDEYWKQTISDLKDSRGVEYIESLLR